jgi:hypothetical protein
MENRKKKKGEKNPEKKGGGKLRRDETLTLRARHF